MQARIGKLIGEIMSIRKIAAAMHMDRLFVKSQPKVRQFETAVNIIDRSMPGDSVEILGREAIDIKYFAHDKGITDVVFFDPRRNLPECHSGRMESDLANRVGILAKSEKGTSLMSSIEYFTQPETKFGPKIFAMLENMGKAFKQINNPEITFNPEVAANMTTKKARKFEAKLLEAAKKVNLLSVNIDPNSVTLVSRYSDAFPNVVQTCYMGKNGGSLEKFAIRKINELEGIDGKGGINHIIGYNDEPHTVYI